MSPVPEAVPEPLDVWKTWVDEVDRVRFSAGHDFLAWRGRHGAGYRAGHRPCHGGLWAHVSR